MTVALFIPCLVDQFHPEVGESVVEIFEKLGVEFDYPEAQTCCGLPLYNMGRWEEAKAPARHFIRVFERFEAVVTPSSSCASMASHFIPTLFADDPAMLSRARQLAAKTHELSSYLVNVAGRTDLGAEFNGSVACHRSCHLRELGARDEAETLIKAVRGVKFVDLPRTEVCCGFGGSFAVKFPALSGAMGSGKCDTIDESKADCFVTTDAGCMMQINGLLHRRGSTRRIRHIAELLTNRVEAARA